MGKFQEEKITEYPSIIKRNDSEKIIKYRIRVLIRNYNLVLDLRECTHNSKGFMFTSNGLSFNQKELRCLIKYLIHAEKEHFSYGSNQAN